MTRSRPGTRRWPPGWGLMPWGVPLIVAAPLAGARIRRAGERRFITGGLVLVAAGAGWLSLAARPSLAYWQVLVPLLLTGLGFSAALPATQSAVMSYVAPQYVGKASGTFTMLRQLGGAFGIAAAVFTGSGSYASAQSFSNGYGPALGSCAALALAGAIAGLLASTRPAASAPAVTARRARRLAADRGRRACRRCQLPQIAGDKDLRTGA